VKVFPADWGRYKNAAGPIRNEQMAKYADALLAVWDWESKGTGNMVKLAQKYKLRTILYNMYHDPGLKYEEGV
jgi:hypothetical protein